MKWFAIELITRHQLSLETYIFLGGSNLLVRKGSVALVPTWYICNDYYTNMKEIHTWIILCVWNYLRETISFLFSIFWGFGCKKLKHLLIFWTMSREIYCIWEGPNTFFRYITITDKAVLKSFWKTPLQDESRTKNVMKKKT